jgi:hypothetical protein
MASERVRETQIPYSFLLMLKNNKNIYNYVR